MRDFTCSKSAATSAPASIAHMAVRATARPVLDTPSDGCAWAVRMTSYGLDWVCALVTEHATLGLCMLTAMRAA